MLGGEIMEAMTLALASAYEGNMKFQDGLNCKSFVEKKKRDPCTRRKMGFFNLANATIFLQGDYFLLHATKTLVALDKNSCKSWLQNPSFFFPFGSK
jgi:hypothetical protein